MPPSPPCPALSMASRRLHLGLLAAFGAFAVLTLLGGCAAPAGPADSPRSIAGRRLARTTRSACAPSSPADAECPDGASSMVPRDPCCHGHAQRAAHCRTARRQATRPSSRRSPSPRASSTCPEQHARQASTDSHGLAGGRHPAHRRRRRYRLPVKVPASGASDPIQDCTSPAAGPGRGSPARRHAPNPIWSFTSATTTTANTATTRALRAAAGQRRSHRLRLGRLECRLLHTGHTAARRRTVGRRARQPRELRSRRRRLDALPLAPALPGLQQPALQDRQPFAAGQQSDGRRLSHRPRQRADAGRRRQRRVFRTIAGRPPHRMSKSSGTDAAACCCTRRLGNAPPVWLLLHRPIWYDLLTPLTARTPCRPSSPASCRQTCSSSSPATSTPSRRSILRRAPTWPTTQRVGRRR
jgi:hypothetical protein